MYKRQVPAEVEDCRRRIEALQTELDIIGREPAVGIDTVQRKAAADEKLQAENARLAELDARWQEEKGLVDQILGLRAQLRGVGGTVEADTETEADPQRQSWLAELKALQAQLHALQGESPLILPSVDAQAIAAVVADWTGIPVGRMVKNEIETVDVYKRQEQLLPEFTVAVEPEINEISAVGDFTRGDRQSVDADAGQVVVDEFGDNLDRADLELRRETGAQRVGGHIGPHRQNEVGLGEQGLFPIGDDADPDAVLTFFKGNLDRRIHFFQAERAAQLTHCLLYTSRCV